MLKKGNNASNVMFHLALCTCPHIPDSIEDGSRCQMDDPFLWTNLKQCEVSNRGSKCPHDFTCLDTYPSHLPIICQESVESSKVTHNLLQCFSNH